MNTGSDPKCRRRPAISQAAKCYFPIVFLFAPVQNCNLCDFTVPLQSKFAIGEDPAKPKVYLWTELTFEQKLLRVQWPQTFLFGFFTGPGE